MTRSLLDVNVLIALFDADHADHSRAWAWAHEELPSGWASCAITENGFVRIISHPRYPSPISAAEAIGLLGDACDTEHHEFWSCDVSLVNSDVVRSDRVHGPKQVTDLYLLALAVARQGRLVTFDGSVPLSAVHGAEDRHLDVI